MKGTITNIQGGEAKSGGRYENLIINGVKYSTKKFAGMFKEGDTIEFEYLENGDFKNLTNATFVSSETITDRDELIIREVAIKAAAEVAKVNGFIETAGDIASAVIKMAGEFEVYIIGEKKQSEPEDDIPY